MGYSFYCFVLGILTSNLKWSLVSSDAIDGRNLNKHSIVKRSDGRVGLTNDERLELVRAHNYFRTHVKPGATEMLRMYWSKELESAAQEWSNKCVWDHGFPDLSQTRFKQHGQNMYLGSQNSNMTNIISLFASEVAHYNLDDNSCTKVCGHYTQVAWSSSYLVGCGLTFCSKLNAAIVTCNYHPPGNWMGVKPYVAGTSCSGCKNGATCKDNLCDKVQRKCEEEIHCTVTNPEYCLCEGTSYLLLSNQLSPNGLLIFLFAFMLLI